MPPATILAGSAEALVRALDDGLCALGSGADVVVVPTAAAFTGMTDAAVAIAARLEGYGVVVEALMVGDRAAAGEAYFARRLREADLVVLGDGAALHAASVWRGTPVGEALRDARCLAAIGSVASLLGEVMIDPRGGAPTTGLGYRPGLAVSVAASPDQLARTRELLGATVTLVALGPLGVVYADESGWRRWGTDLVVTRGEEVLEW